MFCCDDVKLNDKTKCHRLNAYISRLDNSIDNVCPKCGNGPHDTVHLFKCPADHNVQSPKSGCFPGPRVGKSIRILMYKFKTIVPTQQEYPVQLKYQTDGVPTIE